jgi:hypothetical protein
MVSISPTSRQPHRDAWTMERLVNERSISLGYSLDTSSFGTYTSALNSYLTFCNIHKFPVDPTQDTLSFYVVFLSSHIKPDSVNSYLSGICRQLEPFYPDIRRDRKSMLVSRTMTGCLRRFGSPVNRKSPLSHANLLFILDSMVSQPSHDQLLFAALVVTGFHALMRLGELVFPDKKDLRNYRKISLRHSVAIFPHQYSFFLPSHKGDQTFEGNTIIIQKTNTPTNPYTPFLTYLSSRDKRFPIHPELWLTSRGKVPTRHWFISRLRSFFPNNIAGQSLRSGGATSLAEAGADLDTIQAVGRWSSDAFHIYIRKNPVVIHAILLGRPAHQPRTLLSPIDSMWTPCGLHLEMWTPCGLHMDFPIK